MHLVLASSLWLQLWVPMLLALQSASRTSVPLQARLSSQIGPEPAPNSACPGELAPAEEIMLVLKFHSLYHYCDCGYNYDRSCASFLWWRTWPVNLKLKWSLTGVSELFETIILFTWYWWATQWAQMRRYFTASQTRLKLTMLHLRADDSDTGRSELSCANSFARYARARGACVTLLWPLTTKLVDIDHRYSTCTVGPLQCGMQEATLSTCDWTITRVSQQVVLYGRFACIHTLSITPVIWYSRL